MERIKKFERFVGEDYAESANESKTWSGDAIGRPGSLRRKMRKQKGERISRKEIDSELAALRKKDRSKDKPGLQLGANDRRKQRQLVLSKTLRKFN